VLNIAMLAIVLVLSDTVLAVFTDS